MFSNGLPPSSIKKVSENTDCKLHTLHSNCRRYEWKFVMNKVSRFVLYNVSVGHIDKHKLIKKYGLGLVTLKLNRYHSFTLR